MKKRTRNIILAAVLAALTLSATALHAHQELSRGKIIQPDEAKAAALAKAGVSDADIRGYELDFDDGRWEIDFHADGVEHDIVVDAYTGEILRHRTEPERRSGKSAPKDPAPAVTPAAPPVQTEAPVSITREQAITSALTAAGIAADQAYHIEAELDDGRWEVEFYANGWEYEIKVNRTTGEILRIEKDDD